MEEINNYFIELNSIDVSDYVETKGGAVKLNYLSWAYAWGEIKKRYPTANYTVYENNDGWNYFTDGRTAWVKTGVTINGLEHIEYLPVMNNSNKSIPLKDVTSFDVNKAIQRSITKAIARHGLGLYIYAGEDLPIDTPKEEPLPVTAEQLNRFEELGVKLDGVLKKYGIKQITQLTMDEANEIIALKEAYLAREKRSNKCL